MLAVQLHPLDAAVVVDLEAIGELYARSVANLRILGSAADVTEGNGLDRIGAAGSFEPHFQMPAADDPCLDDVEVAVE